jgi:hypothetical protein
MAPADDRRHARQHLRVGLGQQLQVGIGRNRTVQPGVGVDFGEVDGAAEGARPVGPGRVEVRVGD